MAPSVLSTSSRVGSVWPVRAISHNRETQITIAVQRSQVLLPDPNQSTKIGTDSDFRDG